MNNEPGGLHQRLKLAPWRHSGQLLPHKHTSHGVLLVIIVAVGIMLAIATKALQVSAGTLSQQGDITVSGTVPGPPPSQPAVILVPKNGQVFNTSPIDVSGTCPANVVVEI